MKKSNQILLATSIVFIVSLVIFNIRMAGAYKTGNFSVSVADYSNYWKNQLTRVSLPRFKHLVVNGAIIVRKDSMIVDSASKAQSWEPVCLVSNRQGKENSVYILNGLKDNLRWILRNDSLFISIEKKRVSSNLRRANIWDPSLFIEVEELRSITGINAKFRVENLAGKDSLDINLGRDSELNINWVGADALTIRTGERCLVRFGDIAFLESVKPGMKWPAVRYLLGRGSSIELAQSVQPPHMTAIANENEIVRKTTITTVLSRPDSPQQAQQVKSK
ncbi:hypothetical protein [Pedobacter sp. SYP-B3415]|uniref:hypothetical protein n=1 Tax=Pedobacter sp. SYP-B3415 TaxID=2496641 RepID=UPI00101D5A4E|nr:hypothetical protein [Pedobacter sp. SYP-B3415]